MSKQASPAVNYCFTFNNYTKEDEIAVQDFGKSQCDGIIYGHEKAPETGTPHLQGYFKLRTKQRITFLKKVLPKVHFEVAKGSVADNIKYCSKGENIYQDGFFEVAGGSKETIRSQVNKCICWSDVLDIPKIEKHMQYARECWANRKLPRMENVVLREWQQKIVDIINGPADDRTIYWVHDSKGGKGKTFFAKYLACNYGAFYTRPGKSSDIICLYDCQKLVVYDIPRTCDEQYHNYGLIEQIKDGMMFSGKFTPLVKVRKEPVHLVVMSNDYCSDDVFSSDRIKLIELDDDKRLYEAKMVCDEVNYACNVGQWEFFSGEVFRGEAAEKLSRKKISPHTDSVKEIIREDEMANQNLITLVLEEDPSRRVLLPTPRGVEENTPATQQQEVVGEIQDDVNFMLFSD